MARFRVVIEAETDQGFGEMLAVANELGLRARVERVETGAVAPMPQPRVSTPALVNGTGHNDDVAWGGLMSRIKEPQKDVLRCIKEHPQGMTAKQIGEALDRGTTSITGSIGPGLNNNIPKAGFKMEQIIVIRDVGGVATYFPGPVLLAHAVT